MKNKTKLSCPQCKREWGEGSMVTARVGGDRGITYHIEVSKVPFCLYCLLGHDKKRAEEDEKRSHTGEEEHKSFIAQYSCRGDLVLLEKKEVQLTHIILKNDMGEYIEVPIENIPQLQKYINSKYFDQEEDDDADIGDHNSTWGGAGPDCKPGRFEAAFTS